jgi:hypothetical protein
MNNNRTNQDGANDGASDKVLVPDKDVATTGSPDSNKATGRRHNPKNEDVHPPPEPPTMKEPSQAPPGILLEEKQNISYPACWQGKKPCHGKKEEADADKDQHTPMQDSAPECKQSPVESALLMEEKRSMIYPSCQQAMSSTHSHDKNQGKDKGDPHAVVQDSAARAKIPHRHPVESALLREEKRDIIYPACQGKNEEVEADGQPAERLDKRIADPMNTSHHKSIYIIKDGRLVLMRHGLAFYPDESFGNDCDEGIHHSKKIKIPWKALVSIQQRGKRAAAAKLQ